MKSYFVNLAPNATRYCGHQHKTRASAERCNPKGKVFEYDFAPEEGSLAQYEMDADEDQRSADSASGVMKKGR